MCGKKFFHGNYHVSTFCLNLKINFSVFKMAVFRGGNYMMFGGAVKGGQIVGTYPDNLTDDGERSLGRGRMIPTTSWDAVFLPLAEWAGATAEDFDNVCPNRENFPASHFFDAAKLFEMI